jgi:nucleotide-binding universal stress UspA family protein
MSALTSILVFAESNARAKPRIRCAADLADRFSATLTGLAARPAPAPVAHGRMAVFDADWLVAMRDETEAELRAAEQSFHSEIGTRQAMWRTRRLDPAEALAEAARSADLIVTGSCAEPEAEPLLGLDLPKLLLTAGRTILTVPPGKDYLAGKKVVIAWKDVREARRAVVDAMPFLKLAEEVLVVQVAPEGEVESAREGVAEVAAHLASHGVDAAHEVKVGSTHDAPAILRERARWFGADLLVAGAYGHSRIGEMVMGGLTRSLLHQDELFVLVSH